MRDGTYVYRELRERLPAGVQWILALIEGMYAEPTRGEGRIRGAARDRLEGIRVDRADRVCLGERGA